MKRLIFRVSMLVLTLLLGIALERVRSRESVQMQVPQPVGVSILEPAAASVTVAPPVETPARHMVFDYNPEAFHPEGGYVLMGRKPKEFDEFQYMFLELDKVVDDQLWGFISVGTMTNDKHEDQNASFGLVSERRVFFVTQTFNGGFAYRFDGEFLRRDLLSSNQNTAVLRGTLTKTIKGRKVAERVVSFRIEEDHC